EKKMKNKKRNQEKEDGVINQDEIDDDLSSEYDDEESSLSSSSFLFSFVLSSIGVIFIICYADAEGQGENEGGIYCELI
ncbi:MAG: hypothetical protein EZS28_019431, partial [Streblomastix strix]